MRSEFHLTLVALHRELQLVTIAPEFMIKYRKTTKHFSTGIYDKIQEDNKTF